MGDYGASHGFLVSCLILLLTFVCLMLVLVSVCRHIPIECFNLAKVVFAVYRDVKEHVHHFRTVVGACLAIAYRDLGKCNRLNMGLESDLLVFVLPLRSCDDESR